jgi:hypothetical protein
MIATAQPAAANCVTSTIPWTNLNQCAAPNQNRGSLQGGGTLNTNSRDLFLNITFGFGNTGGQGVGRRILGGIFQTANGPNGACIFNGAPGSPVFSAPGRCNNGTHQRMTINF